jgi:uncharacterized protein YxjI
MADPINKNLFFVKEHVGLFKAANNYDIYDPESGEIILECREDHLGLFTKLFRFSDYKRMTPFDIEVRTPDGRPVVRVKRGITLFLSKVRVYDAKDEEIGGFRQKLWSIGGRFDVLDRDGQAVCSLKGKWTGWEFAFVRDGQELARVTKKWAGLGKELFTTADNYMLSISPDVPPNSTIRRLILAAVMCVDMVLKE